MNERLLAAIRTNCTLSDARDNGIYSICTLVLKLRNLYKWEHALPPWEEPETADMLDWIEARENHWDAVRESDWSLLPVNGEALDPFSAEPAVNRLLAPERLLYGAGYGRSMKAVFFVAEIVQDGTMEGMRTVVLDRELARELASPFALLQEDTIFIRRDPFRFFLWDQIQEARPSGRSALRHALACHGLLTAEGKIDRPRLIASLDALVDMEIPVLIRHELGERLDNPLDRTVLRQIVAEFPGSVIELFSRSLKDILADTHERGPLAFVAEERQTASLGFYVAFLDGLRRQLFPEIIAAHRDFMADENWQHITRARLDGRRRVKGLADRLTALVSGRPELIPAERQRLIEEELLAPLGLPTGSHRPPEEESHGE